MSPPQAELHIGYSTNIHPGESWADVAGALKEHVPSIKQRVSPDQPFGLGLRLSAAAACELEAPAVFDHLAALLDELDCYIFSLNGFPFGAFHGTRVKENVYLPDWQTPERLAYTTRLAELLARVATRQRRSPRRFTISTVPGCFRSDLVPGGVRLISRHLVQQAIRLRDLRERTGVHVTVALEPEPGCLLETTAELVSFFQAELCSGRAASELGVGPGIERSELEALCREYLGICFDACHAAVQFESATGAWELLARSGIEVGKIQATSALRIPAVSHETLARLAEFDDGVYLHQGTLRAGTELTRFLDLDAVLGRSDLLGQELRVHFHVPVFERSYGALESTQDFLSEVLALQRARPLTDQVEVETYTFGVLPAEHRPAVMSQAIAREIAWTKRALGREDA